MKNIRTIFNISNTHEKRDLFLTSLTLLILNPTFAQFNVFFIAFTLIALYSFKAARLYVDGFFIFGFILITFVTFGQAIAFGSFSIMGYVGVLLIFALPYFIVRVVGLNYLKHFVSIVYFFAIISLVFWLLQNLSDQFTQLLSSISHLLRLDPISNESIIIYNLEYGRGMFDILKNPGFLAEGGAYSCLLILGLFFNSFKEKSMFETKNVVFILALITTQSSAGYTALGIYFVGVSITHRNILYKLIFAPLFILLSIYMAVELPFLMEKVTNYYTNEMRIYNTTANPSRIGRFLSARVDIDLILEHPLYGRGIHKETRYLTEREEEIGYSNSYLGVVGLASRYGILVWFLYFFFQFKFIKKMSVQYRYRSWLLYTLAFFISLIAVGLGQNPFTSPPYLVMMFIGYYYRNGNETFDSNPKLQLR